MPDFNSPFEEWGGADPRGYEDRLGRFWWSALEKGPDDKLKLIVYCTSPTGQIVSTWADSGITGQGGLLLQANGRLDAVGFITQGANATRRAVPVPGWVPVAQQSGGGLTVAERKALARLIQFLGILA